MNAQELMAKARFELHGYFVADRVDHAGAKPVFNLAVGLRDGWVGEVTDCRNILICKIIKTDIK